MKPLDPSRRSHGFTLIELLVVIALIIIVAAMTMPSVTGIQDSTKLTQSASLIRDQLNLARQMAITLNQPVMLNLCKTPDEGGTAAFNLVVLSKFAKDGTRVLLDRPVRLPSSFAVSEKKEYSSLMDAPSANVTIRSSESRPSREIRFEPSGSTTLDPAKPWFLSIRRFRSPADLESADLGSNFVTLAIDPITGRVFSYQP